MFSKLIRDFKIRSNHKKRVRSLIVQSSENIVHALYQAKDAYLEAERKEIKEDMVRYKAVLDTLEWLTNGTN